MAQITHFGENGASIPAYVAKIRSIQGCSNEVEGMMKFWLDSTIELGHRFEGWRIFTETMDVGANDALIVKYDIRKDDAHKAVKMIQLVTADGIDIGMNMQIETFHIFENILIITIL